MPPSQPSRILGPVLLLGAAFGPAMAGEVPAPPSQSLVVAAMGLRVLPPPESGVQARVQAVEVLREGLTNLSELNQALKALYAEQEADLRRFRARPELRAEGMTPEAHALAVQLVALKRTEDIDRLERALPAAASRSLARLEALQAQAPAPEFPTPPAEGRPATSASRGRFQEGRVAAAFNPLYLQFAKRLDRMQGREYPVLEAREVRGLVHEGALSRMAIPVDPAFWNPDLVCSELARAWTPYAGLLEAHIQDVARLVLVREGLADPPALRFLVRAIKIRTLERIRWVTGFNAQMWALLATRVVGSRDPMPAWVSASENEVSPTDQWFIGKPSGR